MCSDVPGHWVDIWRSGFGLLNSFLNMRNIARTASPRSVVVVSSAHSVYLLTGMCTPLYLHPMSRYVPAHDKVCLPFPVLVVLVSMYVCCYTVWERFFAVFFSCTQSCHIWTASNSATVRRHPRLVLVACIIAHNHLRLQPYAYHLLPTSLALLP